MNLLFVNQLTVVDFSYLHPDRGLVGETWIADIELEGDLDAQGMVMDFGPMKKLIRAFIDSRLDHRLLVPALSANLRIHPHDDRMELDFTYSKGQIRFSGPVAAVSVLDLTDLSPDTVAKNLAGELTPLLPANVRKCRIIFRHEAIADAYYHYSHGLKQHTGLCQRIAHGHRSRLQIFADEQRMPGLEVTWAGHWRDIYLGNRHDCLGTLDIHGVEHLQFAYSAPEGPFGLTLPREQCYLIDTESTVENLASHICKQLQTIRPGPKYRVRLFEGLNKGAEATSP